MSNLPHPLGDANPGEMFYPGSPTVLASDVPSANGSRAVDFGEDGLSSVVNRGLYALAKNDEYQEARLEQDIARPELVTFTPAGGNGGSYTYSVDVWCGDTAYTPEDQSVRNGLISVLDQRYNDLVDPTSGDQIVVKEILDAPAGSSQVGAGFITNPYITFRKMDPITGALGADYQIPDGTKVWLAFGQRAQLDELGGGTPGSMQDAWFRGFTRSIGEIHAGSFLHDGSRKATGNFNMDGNNVIDINQLQNVDTNQIVVRGTGAAGHVDLYSDDLVRFRDQYNSSYVPLNDADTGVSGYYSSLLTSLNSKSKVLASYMGNRLLSKSGLITYTPGTGQIDWPALDVVIDGEQRTIAAGNLIATNSSAHFLLVVDNTGTVVERVQQSLDPTDIPLDVHSWNGAAFTVAFDVRWVYNGTSRNIEITCGQGNADFPGSELEEAIALACRLSYISSSGSIPRVRILGYAHAPFASPYNIQLSAPVEIVGDGVDAFIRSDENNGHSVDFIDCNGHKIIVRNLEIRHSGNIQATTLGAFKNAGDGSIFQNLKFTKDGGTWDVGFSNAFIWTSAAKNVLIENIRTTGIRHCFVNGSDPTFATAYLTESVVRDCWMGWEGLALYGLVVNGDGNAVYNVEIPTGLDDYGIVVGNDTLVDKCKIRMSAAAGAAPAGVYYAPTASPTYHQGAIIRDTFFLRIPGAGVKSSAINNSSLVLDVKVRNCSFNQVDMPIDFNDVVAVSGYSMTLVDGCRISNTNQFVGSYENVGNNKFINNICTDIGGDGLYIRGNAGADICNNNFEGYGSAGTQGHAIAVDLGVFAVQIKDNVIGSVGAPASSIQVDVWRKCQISGNSFIGSASAATGLSVNTWFFFAIDLPAAVDCRINDNFFDGHGTAAIHLNRGTATVAFHCGALISGNDFFNIPAGGWGVHVDVVSSVDVLNNMFNDCAGSSVRAFSTTAGGGTNIHVCGNRFRNVQGNTNPTPYGYAIVGIHGIQCRNAVVNGNRFLECGMTAGSASMVQSIINVDGGDACQVNNNYIDGMKGISSASDQGDTSNGIYFGPGYGEQSQIHGNYIVANLGLAGRVADRMWGIRVEGDDQSIVGNRVWFYGTQPDTNKTDIIYGIMAGSSHEGYLVASNYADVAAVVSGITIQRSFLINNDFSSITGNFGNGGDMDFTAYNVIITGNFHLTGGSLVYATHALVQPDTQSNYNVSTLLPFTNINSI